MNSIKSTKNILNAFFIPEITHLIQWYALPDDIIFKKRMGDVIKNINILIREKKNNRGIHEYYNINLEKLTFYNI